jgi:hypothetical protein
LCVPALIASNAAFRLVYVVGPGVPAVATTLICACDLKEQRDTTIDKNDKRQRCTFICIL